MSGGLDYTDSKKNFILQQGLDTPAQESCPVRFSALMFQPRLLGAFILLAVIIQSPAIFLVLSGVLWWNVLIPRLNPFDLVYNRTLACNPPEPSALDCSAPSPARPGDGRIIRPGHRNSAPAATGDGCPRIADPASFGPCRTGFRQVLPGLVPVPSPSRKTRFRERYPSVEDGIISRPPLDRRCSIKKVRLAPGARRELARLPGRTPRLPGYVLSAPNFAARAAAFSKTLPSCSARYSSCCSFAISLYRAWAAGYGS